MFSTLVAEELEITRKMEMTLTTIEDLFYEYADARYNGDVTIFREAGIFKVGFGKLDRDDSSLQQGDTLRESMNLCLKKAGLTLFNTTYKLDESMKELDLKTDGSWRLQPSVENMGELELYDDTSRGEEGIPILTVNLSDNDNTISLRKLENLQLMVAAPYMFYLLKDCLSINEIRKDTVLTNRILNCLMPIVQEPITQLKN